MQQIFRSLQMSEVQNKKGKYVAFCLVFPPVTYNVVIYNQNIQHCIYKCALILSQLSGQSSRLPTQG